ncbi:hypothetical protein THRCLA_22943 [Thraustotheca clavata]|uniref:THIF-type NAD/FAD binding fold domain-containing protein n=1 Tax=Thraustotheca clavata TaxID=74557 RepID=A0A1V9YMP1_9STRA|nr:hypothetical protein THRCLA_22943 [Thraustotheca clavata]
MATPKEFYSRAVVAYGPQWMKTISSLHVLVVGLRSVGIEFVKCMAMNGVRVITVYDDTIVTEEDLSSCAWFGANDVGKRKSNAVQMIVTAKNPHILVRTLSGTLTPDLLLNYHVCFIHPFHC